MEPIMEPGAGNSTSDARDDKETDMSHRFQQVIGRSSWVLPTGWLRLVLGLVAGGALVIGVVSRTSTPARAFADAPSIFQATLMEPSQKTTEVSTDDLRRLLADGSAVVFDSRPHLEYAVSHIPGALNVAPKPGVPMSLYVSDVAEIGRVVPDPDTPVVLYCNGPFCGKSKRLAEELLAAGHTDVRRYQLGAPTWRALVGVMEIEPDGVRYVRDGDRTAVFLDARTADEFRLGSLSGARNVPLADVATAKDDGRLPMEDHNTRIVVFGADAVQARAVTAELAKNAFHNVAYFAGALEDLAAVLGEGPVAR
jgi:rhodanese-related sulfurtransferase